MIENGTVRAAIAATLILLSACAGRELGASQPDGGWRLVPVSMVEPPFPPEALAHCIAGVTVIEFSLLSDGTPTNFSITESTPPGMFDDATYAAVRRWKFEPPLPDDVLVRRYQLPMEFKRLANCQPQHLVHETDIALACTPPGVVELGFTVNAAGEVEDLRILSSTLPVEYDVSVLKHVREMKFKPRIVNGTAIPRVASMKLDSSTSTCDE